MKTYIHIMNHALASLHMNASTRLKRERTASETSDQGDLRRTNELFELPRVHLGDIRLVVHDHSHPLVLFRVGVTTISVASLLGGGRRHGAGGSSRCGGGGRGTSGVDIQSALGRAAGETPAVADRCRGIGVGGGGRRWCSRACAAVSEVHQALLHVRQIFVARLRHRRRVLLRVSVGVDVGVIGTTTSTVRGKLSCVTVTDPGVLCTSARSGALVTLLAGLHGRRRTVLQTAVVVVAVAALARLVHESGSSPLGGNRGWLRLTGVTSRVDIGRRNLRLRLLITHSAVASARALRCATVDCIQDPVVDRARDPVSTSWRCCSGTCS